MAQPLTQITFNSLAGIAGNGTRAYVSDSGTQLIYRIDDGKTVAVVAGQRNVAGTKDGAARDASFTQPTSLALAADGTLYILDGNAIRALSADGQVSTLAGSVTQAGYAEGTGSTARFNGPKAIALGADGNLYIADTGNLLIRKVTPSGVVTTMGATSLSSARDNPGAVLGLQPVAIAVDRAGNAFVAVTLKGGPGTGKLGQGDVLVMKMTPTGGLTRVFGKFAYEQPYDIAPVSIRTLTIGSDDTLYVVGKEVYRLPPAGGGQKLLTLPPTVVVGQATLESPTVLWLTDTGNNKVERVILPATGTDIDSGLFVGAGTVWPPVTTGTGSTPGLPPGTTSGPTTAPTTAPTTDSSSATGTGTTAPGAGPIVSIGETTGTPPSPTGSSGNTTTPGTSPAAPSSPTGTTPPTSSTTSGSASSTAAQTSAAAGTLPAGTPTPDVPPETLAAV